MKKLTNGLILCDCGHLCSDEEDFEDHALDEGCPYAYKDYIHSDKFAFDILRIAKEVGEDMHTKQIIKWRGELKKYIGKKMGKELNNYSDEKIKELVILTGKIYCPDLESIQQQLFGAWYNELKNIKFDNIILKN